MMNEPTPKEVARKTVDRLQQQISLTLASLKAEAGVCQGYFLAHQFNCLAVTIRDIQRDLEKIRTIHEIFPDL